MGPAPTTAQRRPVGALAQGGHARGQLVEARRGIDRVRDVAVHVAHVDGLVEPGAAAAVVAGVLADAASGGRQRVVEHHGEEGLLQPVFLEQLEAARDVHVQRAGVLAGADGELLADARAAAARADVVFELVPEVPHGRQHRVRGRLAEAAQRGVADHPAELVEDFEVFLGALAVGEARQIVQALVEAGAAGNALAAAFRVGEFDEVAGHVDHAVVFVHHHHAAGARDGAELG